MPATHRFTLVVFCVLALTGCGLLTSRSQSFRVERLRAEDGWIAIPDIEFVNQEMPTHCGYAVAAMTLGYWYRRPVGIEEVARELPKAPARGLTAAAMRTYFRSRGFHAFVVEGEVPDLIHELSNGRPVIVGTVYRQRDHFIAHYEVVSGINLRAEKIVTLDPRFGWRVSSITDFYRSWALAKRVTLVVSADGAASAPARITKDGVHLPRAFSPLDGRLRAAR